MGKSMEKFPHKVLATLIPSFDNKLKKKFI